MTTRLDRLISEWDYASATEEREKLRLVLEALSWSLSQLPITAAPTPTADTPASQWAAQAQDSTTPTDSPLHHPGEQIAAIFSHAEQCYECRVQVVRQMYELQMHAAAALGNQS